MGRSSSFNAADLITRSTCPNTTLQAGRLDTMVTDDALVTRYHDVVCQGTLSRQWDLVPRGLVDPAQREILVLLGPVVAAAVGHRVARIGLAHRRLLRCL